MFYSYFVEWGGGAKSGRMGWRRDIIDEAWMRISLLSVISFLFPDHSTDNTPAPLQPESHRTSLIKASADHCLEYYVSCSLCGYMHANVWMPRLFQTVDPELDVEAHLGGRGNESARSKAERQRRLRCFSGSLCSEWT